MRNGFRPEDAAKKLCVDVSSFYRKLRGMAFSLDEISILSDWLGLTAADIYTIVTGKELTYGDLMRMKL